MIDTTNEPLFGSLAGAELRAIDRIVALFQLCLLPPKLWTHRVRAAIGLRYVLRYGFEDGLRRLRSRSRDYHAAIGSIGDYHETETVYMLWTIAEFRRRHPFVRHRVLLYQRLLEDGVSSSGFLARAYSPDRLAGASARRRFVAPDRVPLPTPVRERLHRVSVRQAALCTTIPGTLAAAGPASC